MGGRQVRTKPKGKGQKKVLSVKKGKKGYDAGGRPTSKTWALFTNDKNPQQSKQSVCKHCYGLISHHKKIVRVREHLKTCLGNLDLKLDSVEIDNSTSLGQLETIFRDLGPKNVFLDMSSAVNEVATDVTMNSPLKASSDITESQVEDGRKLFKAHVNTSDLKTSNTKNYPTNVVLSSQNAYPYLFTRIRDADTKTRDFIFYSKRICRLLIEDVLSELPKETKKVQTPCGPFEGITTPCIDNGMICAVSIMRAGDALLESLRECLPDIHVGKILIQRNETHETKHAIHYYTKFPPNINKMIVILCDPMLATGGSSSKAITTLEEAGVLPSNIIFANVISCPEGVQALLDKHPQVKIVTACIDKELNEDKYIVPGLGDYGDRFFNT